VFGFVENSMHYSIVGTVGIALAQSKNRDDSPREITKILFHRVNIIYMFVAILN
jgi:hypothetical protein